MIMKAIGIVGSPRKNGNVDTLVQTVLDGALDAGYQIAKYISTCSPSNSSSWKTGCIH